MGIEEGREKAYIGGVAAKAGLASFEGGEKEAILGEVAASLYKAEVGENITVSGETLKVRGLLKSSGILLVDGVLLLPLQVAQKIFLRNGSVSAVLLTSETLTGVGAIADSVERGFPKLQVVTQKDMAKNLDQQLTNMRVFMDGINNAVLAVAVIIVLVVMVITVMERTREIGTFRAIGTPRYKVLLMILFESLLISLLGFIAGVVLSYVIMGNWWGWSFYANFLIRETQILLQAVYIALIIGALAGLYPAYRAAKISPLEAMRYE